MKLGEAIKEIRKELKYNQYDLADAMNTTQSYLSQVESGSRFPSSTFIENVCMAMKIEPEVLYLKSCEIKLRDTHEVQKLEVIKYVLNVLKY